MSLLSEINEILTKVDNTVNRCLETDISDIADACIQLRVASNVYAQYEPTEYERRGTAGGLADPGMYTHDVDGASHTLTVSDNRHEVEVVESGVGYTWERSRIFRMQPFPRPYFEDAQDDVYANGNADDALKRAVANI